MAGTKKHKQESERSQIGSQSSLPSYNEATAGIFTKNQRETKKKKIIPVQSDFDSSSDSPSPSPPSLSPVPTTQSRMRVSQSSVNLVRTQDIEVSNVVREALFDI